MNHNSTTQRQKSIKKILAEQEKRLSDLEIAVTEAQLNLEVQQDVVKSLRDKLCVPRYNEISDVPNKPTIEKTFELFSALNCKKGVPVSKVVEEYKKIGINTYDRILREHVNVLLKKNRICQTNLPQLRGRKYAISNN